LAKAFPDAVQVFKFAVSKFQFIVRLLMMPAVFGFTPTVFGMVEITFGEMGCGVVGFSCPKMNTEKNNIAAVSMALFILNFYGITKMCFKKVENYHINGGGRFAFVSGH